MRLSAVASGPERVEQELDDELAFHLECESKS